MNFKPGDLVMVVKPSPCCGVLRTVGKVRTVLSIGNGRIVHCPDCGTFGEISGYAELEPGKYCQAFRLRLIPPLSELDSTPTRDEVTA